MKKLIDVLFKILIFLFFPLLFSLIFWYVSIPFKYLRSVTFKKSYNKKSNLLYCYFWWTIIFNLKLLFNFLN